jgi:oligosaccharide repeat unit polymerase
MTPLVISLLVVQAVILYRIDKSWLFPPALFAAYWACVIACTTVIRFGDHSMTANALAVFIAGSIVFAIGGCTATALVGKEGRSRPITALRKRFIQNCIIAYGVALLALVPMFFNTLKSVSETLGIEDFAVAARFAFTGTDRSDIPRYFLSMTSVGAVLAYSAAWLYDGKRRDKVVLGIAVIAPLMMSVLTFARTPIYMLLSGVMAIMLFRNSVRKRTVLTFALLGILFMIIIGAALGKGPKFGSGKSAISAIVENAAVYFVWGPVGFGHVMDLPVSVGESGLSFRFFTQTASTLGMNVKLPNNILGYFSDALGNVYTIYFAYWLDWGWLGVVVMAFFAGFFCTSMYLIARKGNPLGGVSIGIVAGAILNSATGDWIFLSATPWLLLFLIVFILWNMPILVFHSVASDRPASSPEIAQ